MGALVGITAAKAVPIITDFDAIVSVQSILLAFGASSASPT